MDGGLFYLCLWFLLCLVLLAIAYSTGKIDATPPWWDEQWRDLLLVCTVLCIFILCGDAYIFREASDPGFLPFARWDALLWAAACLSSGFLVGFIFAIPRPGEKSDADKKSAFVINANLNEVSDWLTKIVVGLGLVELTKIPGKLDVLSHWMAVGLSKSTSGPDIDRLASISSAIIVYSAVLGFLGGYLITVLFLAAAFERAKSVTEGTFVHGFTIESSFGLLPNESLTRELSTSEIIRNFWRRGDIINPDNEKALLFWLAENSLNISIASFIYDAKLEEERKRAIKEIPLP